MQAHWIFSVNLTVAAEWMTTVTLRRVSSRQQRPRNRLRHERGKIGVRHAQVILGQFAIYHRDLVRKCRLCGAQGVEKLRVDDNASRTRAERKVAASGARVSIK